MQHNITLSAAAGQPATMSSREIAELTGKRHADVMRDIRSMCTDLQNADLRFVCKSSTYTGENEQQYPQYELDKETSLTLLLGYDVAARMRVVKRWQELESQEKPRQLSPAEMFLQSAQAMFAIEKRQDEQDKALAVVSRTIESLADTMLMHECPSNAEPITRIRPRILKEYGIPAHVVDIVMRQLPYSPKPAGMVKNHHENASGSSYAVYWKKDVNTVFKRFVEECTKETACKATHPDICVRFNLK